MTPCSWTGSSVRLVHQIPDRLAVDGLFVEEAAGDRVEPAPVPAQRLERPLLLGAEDQLDLVVDDLAGVLRVVAGVHEVLTEEDLAL